MTHLRLGKRVTTLFGRNKEQCDEQLGHESASRQHAAFVQTTRQSSAGSSSSSKDKDKPRKHELALVDLFSTHGTFLNDEKLEPGVAVSLKGERDSTKT